MSIPPRYIYNQLAVVPKDFFQHPMASREDKAKHQVFHIKSKYVHEVHLAASMFHRLEDSTKSRCLACRMLKLGYLRVCIPLRTSSKTEIRALTRSGAVKRRGKWNASRISLGPTRASLQNTLHFQLPLAQSIFQFQSWYITSENFVPLSELNYEMLRSSFGCGPLRWVSEG